MTLPLSHIKVVEVCQGLAAPLCAMYLADQGADVIKVEPPKGDSSRQPTQGMNDNLFSLRILSFNRNKRAMVLDLSKPKAQGIAYDLCKWADVLVINTRKSARQRRGLTYEEVAAINPRIIYASITGYGDAGPEADLPGIDLIIQARAGDLAARRMPGQPLPGQTFLWHFDMSAAILGFGAVALALYERECTGLGQKVEVNLLQSALVLQALQLTRIGDSNEGSPPKPLSPPNLFPCSDGRYIYVTFGRDRWEPFCRAVGLEDILADSRFDTQEKRTQNEAALHEVLSRHFSTRNAQEWEATLKAVGQFVTIVKETDELYQDPQAIANRMFTQFEQPNLGTITAVNFPIGNPAHAEELKVRRPVPALGEHTYEVLQEMGRRLEEIEALKAEGVIG